MKKQQITILALVLLGLVTVGLIGYVAMNESPEPATNTPVVQEPTELNSTSTETPSEDRAMDEFLDTSTWKTYENKELGVSFRYPKNWEIEIIADNENSRQYYLSSNNKKTVWIDFREGKEVPYYHMRGGKFSCSGTEGTETIHCEEKNGMVISAYLDPATFRDAGPAGDIKIVKETKRGVVAFRILYDNTSEKSLLATVQSIENGLEEMTIETDEKDKIIFAERLLGK